jgi:metal-responsive CopG/Arc/MetJ family transcriptional regulator
MKVMVSLPEETVRRLDELARRAGTSRSALIRQLADDAAEAGSRQRAAQVARLYGKPKRRGGDALEAVKQARRER